MFLSTPKKKKGKKSHNCGFIGFVSSTKLLCHSTHPISGVESKKKKKNLFFFLYLFLINYKVACQCM